MVHGITACGFLSTFDRKKDSYIVSYFFKGKIGVLYIVNKRLKPRLPAFFTTRIARMMGGGVQVPFTLLCLILSPYTFENKRHLSLVACFMSALCAMALI